MEPAVLLGRSLVSRLSGVVANNILKLQASNKAATKEMDSWIDRRIGRSPNAYATLARQSAYNLILKAMIYEIVSTRTKLASLTEGTIDSYLAKFENAYHELGWDAFRPSLLDAILEGCDHDAALVLQKILDTLRSLASQPADLIGRLYEELIPQEDRRRLGEFYTPRHIATFMVRWALNTPSRVMLDPACGSGEFLVEALYRYLEMGLPAARAVSLLRGIDFNPLAVTMTTANLLIRAPQSLPSVKESDFLKLSISPEVDAIVCNPPYSRHHELSRDYKREVGKTMSEEAGRRISGLASLYVPFLIHAIAKLRNPGRIAFITPDDYLDVDYGIELKEFLLQCCNLRAIILFHEESLVFRESLTTACITLIESGRSDDHVTIVKLDSWPSSLDPFLDVIEGRRDSLSEGRVFRIRKQELDPSSKWSRLGEPPLPRSKITIPLGEIARVKRGIATGANNFFILSEREIARWKIHRKYLRPIITNARSIPQLDFTLQDFEELRRRELKTWLLDVSVPAEGLNDEFLLRYLEYGKKQLLHRRYLTKSRSQWYTQERRPPPPIMFPLMIRENPRFVLNQANALISNNLHGVYLKDQTLEKEPYLKALLAYLNSTFALEALPHVGRRYGGGLLKLEPREVESLPIVDVREFSEPQLKELADAFDRICIASRNGKMIEARATLDAVVKRIGGLVTQNSSPS